MFCGDVVVDTCDHVGLFMMNYEHNIAVVWLVSKVVDTHSIFGTKVILALMTTTTATTSSPSSSTLQFTLSTIWLFRIIVCQRVMLLILI